MKKNGIVTEYFECECHSDEHTLKWEFVEDDPFPEWSELLCIVFLNNNFTRVHLPLWVPNFIANFIESWLFIPCRRFWTGLKYMLGYKCRYGHWDCFTLDPSDCDRMIEMIQRFKQAREKIDKHE